MDKDEWSDDDLDDVDEVVVPMSMVPKPQVLSGGQNLGGQYGGGENRASAYNERMERARNAVQNQRKGSTSGTRHAPHAFFSHALALLLLLDCCLTAAA